LALIKPEELVLDFRKSKYKSINAKQYDKACRQVCITCKDNGNIVKIDRNQVYAFVRYRRSDGVGLVHACKVTDDGRIIMTLQKDMLEVEGKCYADIVLIESDTARNPVAENGFFVTDAIYDEENRELELFFSPRPNIDYHDGMLSMTTIDYNGEELSICSDPAPFVSLDKNGNLVFATINETGEIEMQNPSILSTMNFCVNVIDSSFYDCVEILR